MLGFSWDYSIKDYFQLARVYACLSHTGLSLVLVWSAAATDRHSRPSPFQHKLVRCSIEVGNHLLIIFSFLLFSHLPVSIMDTHPNPPLLASSESNREHKICVKCSEKRASSFCSRCQVTPYCSKDCQRGHWPAHKTFCKPYEPPRARGLNDGVSMALALIEVMKGTWPSDWETPYNYIYIAPCDAMFSSPATIAAITGINDSFPGLLVPFAHTSPALNARFCWSSTGSKDVLGGFSCEDIFAIRVWRDDTFCKSLPENTLGSHFSVKTGVRGGVLVQKFVAPTALEKGLATCGREDGTLTLTRREVWEISMARFYYSANGFLSHRILRENIRQKESQVFLSSMGFKFI